MLDDSIKKAPITKTNLFNYMNVGRRDAPTKEEVSEKRVI
jgi:hypothetical protein